MVKPTNVMREPDKSSHNTTGSAVCFATTAYGYNYTGFLLCTIHSIYKSNPKCSCVVYWDQMDPQVIEAFKKAYPSFKFTQVSLANIDKDPNKAISSKVLLWNQAVHEMSAEYICLIDSDVLVIKSIKKFFSEDFDVAFTDKPENWPLNTGVLLIKRSQKSVAFIEAWEQETFKIMKSEKDITIALSKSHPYGGIDQMSFSKLISYSGNRDFYRTEVKGNSVRLKPFECSVLNETNSVPLADNKHILHYKGGWRDILMRGKPFSKNRPFSKSLEMYLLYLRCFSEALSFVAKADHTILYKDLYIRIPWFVNGKDWTVNNFLYFSYCMFNRPLFLFQRIFIAIRRRLGIIY